MKVFVTGVAGLLGSWWADALLDLGHDVRGCDTMVGGVSRNIPTRIVFHPDACGSRSVADILKFWRPDVLVHCAALPYEGLSVFSPKLIFENVAGESVALFSSAIQAGVKRIVYCSSMARYGCQAQHGPRGFSEEQQPRPEDPYGTAKVAAEMVLRQLAAVHDFEWCIVVPHNIYGPRQRYYDPHRNVVGIFLNAMLMGITPRIYGSGLHKRCFSYIYDFIPVIYPLTFDIKNQVVNIGPDEEPITIRELWDLCAYVTAFDGEPIYLPGRPLEVPEATCDAMLARELVGWETKTSLKDGLAQYVEWIKKVGPRPFEYRLPLEIRSSKAPETWTQEWGSR